MSAKITVRLTSEIANHPLPSKVLLNQDLMEPLDHVLLKLLAYVVFQRERLQLEPRLHDDNIPFIPDLIQLDYEMKPALWIECGETLATKLDKLAVKAPWAELWVVSRSSEKQNEIMEEMRRHNLRHDRYRLLVFETAVFDEMLSVLVSRNELALYRLDFAGQFLHMDFNGLWFEMTFGIDSF